MNGGDVHSHDVHLSLVRQCQSKTHVKQIDWGGHADVRHLRKYG